MTRLQISLTIEDKIAALRSVELIERSAQKVLAAKFSNGVLQLVFDHYDNGKIGSKSLLDRVAHEIDDARRHLDHYRHQTGLARFRKAERGGLCHEGVRL